MLSATFVAYFGPAIANFRRTQPLGCGRTDAVEELSLHAPAMATPLVPDALTGRPFTTTEARVHGVSKHALQSAPWRRIFRDVWCHVDLADTRATRLAAARLVLPAHSVLCGLTAAWVHGADIRRDDDLDVHVGFPKGRRLRPRDGLAVCQETLDEIDWVEIDGVRVTTPLRTTFDCMRWLRGVERLVVADALTHAGLVTLPELQAYLLEQAAAAQPADRRAPAGRHRTAYRVADGDAAALRACRRRTTASRRAARHLSRG